MYAWLLGVAQAIKIWWEKTKDETGWGIFCGNFNIESAEELKL